MVTDTVEYVDYKDILVCCPDMANGGDPWYITIAELVEDHQYEMERMVEIAMAAGVYDEDSHDHILDVFPELLATDLAALREFIGDPDAVYTPNLRLHWETQSQPKGAELTLFHYRDHDWNFAGFIEVRFDADHPEDDFATYEAVEEQMRAEHNLPDDIEIDGLERVLYPCFLSAARSRR